MKNQTIKGQLTLKALEVESTTEPNMEDINAFLNNNDQENNTNNGIVEGESTMNNLEMTVSSTEVREEGVNNTMSNTVAPKKEKVEKKPFKLTGAFADFSNSGVGTLGGFAIGQATEANVELLATVRGVENLTKKNMDELVALSDKTNIASNFHFEVKNEKSLRKFLKSVQNLDRVYVKSVAVVDDEENNGVVKAVVGTELLTVGPASRNYKVCTPFNERLKKDCTEDYMVMDWSGSETTRSKIEDFNGGVVLENNTDGTYTVIAIPYDGAKPFNLTTGEVINRSIEPSYVMYMHSFSAVRNATAIFISYREVCNDKTTAIRNVNSLVDTVCQGAVTLINKKLEELLNKGAIGQKAYKKIMSTFTGRVGQKITGSANWGLMESYGVMSGKFLIPRFDGKLDENGEVIKEETMDGMSFGKASAVAKMLSELLSKMYNRNIYVTPSSVEGLVMQVRPGMVKASMIVVNDTIFEAIWDKHKDSSNIHSSIITDDKLKAKDFVPDFLFDQNSIKADWNFNTDTFLEVLAIAEYSVARTSKQGLNKIVTANPQLAKRVMADLARKAIKDSYDKIKSKSEGDLDEQFKRADMPFSPNDINNLDQVLYNCATFAKDCEALAIGKERANFVKGCAQIINKMKAEIAGGHFVLQSDFTALLNGTSLIPQDVVFCNDLSKQGIIETAIIKHPSQGNYEVAFMKVWGVKEITEVIESTNMSDKIKNALIRTFENICEGVMVTPASTRLMSKLAGLDYDMDSVIAYSDPGILDIMRTIPDIATIISSQEEYNNVQATNENYLEEDYVNELLASYIEE